MSLTARFQISPVIPSTIDNGCLASANAVVRLISDTSEWDSLEPRWNALHSASENASVPLQFRWLRQWWNVYANRYGHGLMIVTVWQGDSLIGALPLYRRRTAQLPFSATRLAFVSTHESEYEETCPDYLDLLSLPGTAEICLRSIASEFEEHAAWDEIDLCDISEHSPLLRLSCPKSQIAVEPRGICPIADLAGGFEQYLSRLSPKTRQHSRQDIRKAESMGCDFSVAQTAAEAEEFYAQLIRLHQARWTQAGKPGCFAARRFTEFHRLLIADWATAGKVVLARLAHHDEPLAVLYCFAVGDKCDYYQSGIVSRPLGELRSPGTAALLLLMRYLAGRGIEKFDFLRGSSLYKTKLATHESKLFRIRLTRPSLRVRADDYSRKLGNFIGQIPTRVGKRLYRYVRYAGTAPVTIKPVTINKVPR